MKREIQIDREFMNLTVPLRDDAQEELERSLMREGCLEPIIIWRGVILDGHKRYKFCSYEDIAYETREMDFSSREEATIWVCQQRLESVKVHTPMYRYLVGKWYVSLKALNRERRKVYGKEEQNPEYAKEKRNSVWDTSSRLAEIVGISRCTIENNGKYAMGLDRVADTEPALFEAILREDVYIKYAEVQSMAQMEEKQIREIKWKMLGKKDIKMRRRNRRETLENREKVDPMEEMLQINTRVKEMPTYDPDMEIRGLSLTVPTWISTILKTEKKMNVSLATDKAKEQLAANLGRLQEEVSHMLEVLR